MGLTIFALLILACAGGIWQKRYGAVLGFQALVLLVVSFCALLLIRARHGVGFVAAVAGLVGPACLLFRLVRVLSRIQLPIPPGVLGTVAGRSRHARDGAY